MTAAHTPGPWVMRHEAESGHYEVRDDFNQIVAHVFYVTNVPCLQGEADARLIAAAPVLLEALDFMVNVSRSTPGFSAMAREQAERAISLAKGESK